MKIAFGSLPTTPIDVSAGDPDDTVVNITDDDDPQVTVRFESGTYTVAEGDSATIKVILSADPESTVTIELNRDNQDGAQDTDYSGVPDEIVFNEGETDKSFTFTATDDTVDDDGEKVSLTFKDLPDQVSEGTPNEAVINITDDDRPTSVDVNFDSATYTVAEGGNAAIQIVLSDDPEQDVTVPVTATEQDGASDQDYSLSATSVTFMSGETRKTIIFTAAQDTVDDNGEKVKLAFGSITGIGRPGTTRETLVSITDDDDPEVKVSFGAASYTVAEGNTVTVKVVLSADPERSVTIDIDSANENGAEDTDYSGIPETVTFDEGETEQEFTVTATNDTVDDDGEKVRMSFINLPTRVAKGTPDESVIEIDDDDKPTSLTVSFQQAGYTVAEGSNIVVKVLLSDDPERDVTIQLTKTNQDGATDSDYSGVPTQVVFNSGDTEKSFTFNAGQRRSRRRQ